MEATKNKDDIVHDDSEEVGHQLRSSIIKLLILSPGASLLVYENKSHVECWIPELGILQSLERCLPEEIGQV